MLSAMSVWIDALSPLVALAASGIAIYSVWLRRRQLTALRWAKVTKTVDVLLFWMSPQMMGARADVVAHFWLKDGAIDFIELRKKTDWPQLERSVVAVLNYLDLIAMGCIQGVFDKELCFGYFGILAPRMYEKSRPFIEELRTITDVPGASLQTHHYLEVISREWKKRLEDNADENRRRTEKPFYGQKKIDDGS